MKLRSDLERYWLRIAARIGHLFPRLPSQTICNRQLRGLGPQMSAAAVVDGPPGPTWHKPLRPMDGPLIRCGTSPVTVYRPSLGEIAGYGMDKAHHAFYRGTQLMSITTADGSVTAFSLVCRKAVDEREQALHLLHARPIAPMPCPIVCDKGFAGAGIEKAAADLGHHLIRPARDDEPGSVPPFPEWLRQRIEAIIRTPKNQLGLERTMPAAQMASGHASVSASSTPSSGTTGTSAQPVSHPPIVYDHKPEFHISDPAVDSGPTSVFSPGPG